VSVRRSAPIAEAPRSRPTGDTSRSTRTLPT
jgi:hypothetical protein